MTFLSATLVAVYVRPNGLPKFIAGKPDLLGLTDATSNAAVFSITSSRRTLSFCCGLDAFIAVVVTGLPALMMIDVKPILTNIDRTLMPSP